MTVAALTPELTEKIIKTLIMSNVRSSRDSKHFKINYGPFNFIYHRSENDTVEDILNYFRYQIAQAEGLIDDCR
jgi:hypothetical protein